MQVQNVIENRQFHMQRLLNEENDRIKDISCNSRNIAYASELCHEHDSITIDNLNYI